MMHPIHRRKLLIGTAAALAAPAIPAQPTARAARTSGPATTSRVAQILDMSLEQQELSRDYSTGVRLAWATAGSATASVPLVTLETDGSPASLARTLAAIREDRSICALLGTAGERLALDCAAALQREPLDIAHVGPWLADTASDRDDNTLCLFASRHAQLRHALRSLDGMGINELGVVYAGTGQRNAHDAEIAALADSLKLKVTRFSPQAGEDIEALARRLPANVPVVVIFVGGTVEMARLGQVLSARRMQRYLVGLADVNATALTQIGTGAGTSVILTQVVPNAQNSTLPVVRDYRQRLKDLYEETPTAVSLAGYLVGRYAQQVLSRVPAPLTRPAVLAAFRRRPSEDLGGFTIDFRSQTRGSSYVTQTMLSSEGRLIG